MPEQLDARFSRTQAYVVVIDIVGFADADPSEQAEWMGQLLALLNDAAGDLERFSLFPKGDGAVLSLYREGPPTVDTAGAALRFARELLRLNDGGRFSLRLSINYSALETLIDISPDFPAINARQIQVGDGITLAERIIHFAEPDEIVITGHYYEQLFNVGLTRAHTFYPHRDVFVKDARSVELFSYKPTSVELRYVYGPAEKSEQHFKRYAYFPPLQRETIDRFRTLGLRQDLADLSAYAYESIAAINVRRSFVTWSDIYTTLKRVASVATGDVFIVSRSDLAFGFWDTDASLEYLRGLQRTARAGSCLQLKRVFLYRPPLQRPIVRREVLEVLTDLHEPGTLQQLDVAYARGNVLFKYQFGITIFPALRCAIAPIPIAASYDEYLQTIRYDEPQDAFRRYSDADFSTTTFRALVIADESVVADLLAAYDELREAPFMPVVSERPQAE